MKIKYQGPKVRLGGKRLVRPVSPFWYHIPYVSSSTEYYGISWFVYMNSFLLGFSKLKIKTSPSTFRWNCHIICGWRLNFVVTCVISVFLKIWNACKSKLNKWINPFHNKELAQMDLHPMTNNSQSNPVYTCKNCVRMLIGSLGWIQSHQTSVQSNGKESNANPINTPRVCI